MNCFPTKVGEIKGKMDVHFSEPEPISRGEEDGLTVGFYQTPHSMQWPRLEIDSWNFFFFNFSFCVGI